MSTQTSIQDLARLLRRAEYAVRQEYEQSQEVYRLCVGNERLRRLTWTLRNAYRTLVDHTEAETPSSRKDFAILYETTLRHVEMVLESTELRQSSPDVRLLNCVSVRSRQAILLFLRKVRRDHDWVARRVSGLSADELDKFLCRPAQCERQSASVRDTTREAPSLPRQDSPYPLYSLIFTPFLPPGLSDFEDDQRLSLSATLIYRLIKDNKQTGKAEKLCLSIMDAWATLHGWPALKHFEILLTDILQTGTKLIERADTKVLGKSSQHHGYHFKLPKRDEVEEEFYSNAVRNIFKLLDSTQLGGLPPGALTLGHAIMSHVHEDERRHYESFIILQWFFNRFLSTAIHRPERLGIMNDTYISELKRQRILTVLQEKMYSYCVPRVRSASSPYHRTTSDEEIENYVVSIFAKFRSMPSVGQVSVKPIVPDSYLTTSLMDKSFGTPDMAIHICLEDLLNLQSAILAGYPEFPNEDSRLMRQTSTSSTASSRSVIYRIVKPSKIVFNLGSSFQEGGGLAQREADHESFAEDLNNAQSGTSGDTTDRTPELELELRQDLCAAMEELRENARAALGATDHTGEWQEVFVNQDHLSFEPYRPRSTSRNIDPTDNVRRAILQLVRNFSISSSRPIGNQTPKSSSYFPFRFQYDQSDATVRGVAGEHNSQHRSGPPELLEMLLAAANTSFGRREYAVADLYHNAYNTLQKRSDSAEAFSNFSPLLCGLCNEQEIVIDQCEARMEDAILISSQATSERSHLSEMIDDQIMRLQKCRLRMWYTHDVRNTKVWTQAWEVVKCLHRMSSPKDGLEDGSGPSPVSDQTGPSSFGAQHSTGLVRTTSRDRHFPRFPRELRPQSNNSSSVSGLSAFDHGVFEALVGNTDPLVLKKLSKGQSDQTRAWIQSTDIHDFCLGEERIHRLCYEIDDLSRRLFHLDVHSLEEINIDDVKASSLWKSILFRYESLLFRLSSSTTEDTRHFDAPRSANNSDDFTFSGMLRRGSAGDLLSLARSGNRQRGNSLGSLDSPQSRSMLRTSSLVEEAPRTSNPPAQSTEQARSRYNRPASFVSDDVASDHAKDRDQQAIRDFLLQTHLGLISLLISDFACPLFHDGSETDEWHNSDLTETALLRKLHVEDHLRDRILENTQLALEKLTLSIPRIKTNQNASKHLRTKSVVASQFFGGSQSATETFKASLVPPSIDTASSRTTLVNPLERTNSATSYLDMINSSEPIRTPMTPSRSFTERTAQPQKFPLLKAYKEIMHRFSTQTSPYEKMRALYDFELLIVADISPKNNGLEADHVRMAPSMPQTPIVHVDKTEGVHSPSTVRESGTRALAEAMSFRSPDLDHPRVSSGTAKSITDCLAPKVTTPGTDAIVDEIQRLLKLPDLRPKTLFRDLQFIATFIPAHILNMTDEGKVFWDFSLAALAIKRETTDALVDHATTIVLRGQMLMPPPNTKWNHLAGSIRDAVTIFAHAAKEHHPVAMRELGILMLTHPDSCKIVLPAFSDPSKLWGRRKHGESQRAGSSESQVYRVVARMWLERAVDAGDLIGKEWLENLQA